MPEQETLSEYVQKMWRNNNLADDETLLKVFARFAKEIEEISVELKDLKEKQS